VEGSAELLEFVVCFEDTPNEEVCDVNTSGSVENLADIVLDSPAAVVIEV